LPQGGLSPTEDEKSRGPQALYAWGANGNITAVMDGDLDGFINAYLTMKAGQ